MAGEASTGADDVAAETTQGDAVRPENVKEQFRAALERKQARHHASTSADPGDDSKAHGGTSPAHTQRQFRRKSG